MKIDRIGIIGAGQMGAGIALVSAKTGSTILLHDVNPAILNKAMGRIREGFNKQLEQEGMTLPDIDAALGRIRTTTALEEMADVQLVIEAVPEVEELKIQTFQALGTICKPEVLVASNTSSISITKLGRASRRDERVAGMHFMNPVPVMRLVELTRGIRTSEETITSLTALAKRMEKIPVESKDSPGFIVNRILMPMINEAVFALAEGVATAEAIDTAMMYGTNQPMGPLALADRIGLDTVFSICKVLYQDMGDPKFHPCPLLRTYVEAGWLGRKTGRGFYTYGHQ